MHCPFAPLVALLTTYFLAANAYSQSHPSGVTVSCPALPTSDEEELSGSRISIANVTFSGILQLPISDQLQIANSIKQRTYEGDLRAVTEEISERVRAGWQNRGYFKVQVTGKARTLSSSRTVRKIAMNAHVDEGMQYRLGEITFQHNRAITDTNALRSLFPIKDGDILNREKIVAGLESLRKTYGELGYTNFTSAPTSLFDEEQKLISLIIDIDEGNQFYISRIDIVGLHEPYRQEILKNFPTGQVYNPRLLDLWLEKYSSMFNLMPHDPRLVERRLNAGAGTIAITVYACPCPVCYGSDSSLAKTPIGRND